MVLLLVLLVIVGSSNLFPTHISNELQHSPLKALPLPAPLLSTDAAHPHTVGEQKELKLWFQYETSEQK